MLNEFQDMELNALHQLHVRTELEEVEGHLPHHQQPCTKDATGAAKAKIQKYIQGNSNKQRGYIMWIIESDTLPALHLIQPAIIDTTSGIDLTPSQEIAYQKLLHINVNNNGINNSSSALLSRSDASLRLPPEIVAEDSGMDHNQQDSSTSRGVEAFIDKSQSRTSQLSKAKEIVTVAKNAMNIISPRSDSARNVAYTYVDSKVNFDGKY